MQTTEMDQLIADIDAVIAEALQSYGDQNPTEARLVALAGADRLRTLAERQAK